jgi:hypothetical protein
MGLQSTFEHVRLELLMVVTVFWDATPPDDGNDLLEYTASCLNI